MQWNFAKKYLKYISSKKISQITHHLQKNMYHKQSCDKIKPCTANENLTDLKPNSKEYPAWVSKQILLECYQRGDVSNIICPVTFTYHLFSPCSFQPVKKYWKHGTIFLNKCHQLFAKNFLASEHQNLGYPKFHKMHATHITQWTMGAFPCFYERYKRNSNRILFESVGYAF